MNKIEFEKMDGYYSYTIFTDDDRSHIRSSQPCYGELRKYERTHPGECTQPKDSRPGDLRHPFPTGNPVEIYINTTMSSTGPNDLTEYALSNESPFAKGLKDAKMICSENGVRKGVLISADIDPTITVNFFKNINKYSSRSILAKGYSLLKDAGFSYDEVLLFGYLNDTNPMTQISIPNGYTTPTQVSVKRFLGKNPKDLTGGLLSQRVDYNRKSMHEIFQYDDNSLMNWYTFCTKEKGLKAWSDGTPLMNFTQLSSIYREFLDYRLKNEVDPVDTVYQWTTTSGKTNGSR